MTQYPAVNVLSPALTTWQNTMDNIRAPSIGCFYSNYPSASWIKEACHTVPADSSENVGNGQADYAASTSSCCITSAGGQFTSESGFHYEWDSANEISNIYSIQLNTNEFSITYDGHSTNAIQQFVVYTPYCCTAYNIVYIDYWLMNYAQFTCPSGWETDGANCQFLSNGTDTNGYYYPQYLYQQSMGAAVSSTGDEATFCSGTTCCTNNYYDFFQTYNYWTQFDFNAFGWGDSDGAIFTPTSGSYTELTIHTDSSLMSTPSCNTGFGITEEFNNFNLGGPCTPNSRGGINFSEAAGAYYLTMNLPYGGYPSSGYYISVQIGATGSSGSCHGIPYHHVFNGWSGSGTGSYSGMSNPETITLNGPVTETATYAYVHC